MPSVVQHKSNSGTGVSSVAVTLTSPVTSGNTLAVFAAMKDFTGLLTFSISDGVNSYNSRATKQMNSNVGLNQLWDASGASAGSTTVTVSVVGAVPVDMLVVVVWELTTSTFDQAATANGGNTQEDCGNLTPGGASGIAIMGASVIQEGAVPTFTAGSGFNLDEQQQVNYGAKGGGAGQSQVFSSASAIHGIITWDNLGSEDAGIFATYLASTTHSISGNAGVAGAIVVLSGDSLATTTAGNDGSYSFSGLAAGSYIVTPTLTGYTFVPTSIAVVLSGTDSTGNNFVATASSTGIFIGAVTVVSAGPGGKNGPLLGKVHVLGAAPGGKAVPYLGSVVVAAGIEGPSLGDVVVLNSPPEGSNEPFLGTVSEA